jgi:phosphatidylserine/phosphatidylglycerophosphate/cardiolipin synthase-like enzyme
MWAAAGIHDCGKGVHGSVPVGDGTVAWDFCPGDGVAINRGLAARIAAARDRLTLGVMVLTAHDVLAALAGAVSRGVQLRGIYDKGQMDPIVRLWRENPHDSAVVADWETVSAHLVGKQSVPYTPTSTHDFMHLKVLVADDTVTTGSYNFSANAERNAENQLVLTDPAVVRAYSDYLDTLIETYEHAAA